MYARAVDGTTLTLAVDGRLWRDNMVMYDQETHSLWSQLLGEAQRGRWKGKRLRQIPSVLSDWRTWSRQYPEGTIVVLDRSRPHFHRDFYRWPARFVLGISEGGKAKAWNLADLSRAQALNDQWNGDPVLAVFDRASSAARLYRRTLRARVLTFQYAGGKLTDRQTGSTWEPVTGRALTGPLAGRFLTPLPAVVSYRDTWHQFHP